MNEDQLFAVVGRLYIRVLTQDNEIKQLRGTIREYENSARAQHVEPVEPIPTSEDPSDG